MRLAIISDIHGNVPALEAALADIERHGTDRLVCLGDVASFGPQPREALERLRSLRRPIVMGIVLGNTDDSLLEPRTLESVENPTEDSPRFIDVESWCAGQLDDEDREFVRSFQATLSLELDGATLLCFHGSPRSYHHLITATTPDETLADFFSGQSATLMAGGHSHAQLLRRFRETTFVNPGSVGLPFEHSPDGKRVRNPPWAEYALLTHEDARLSVEFKRAPYDTRPVLEAALASGMPHVDWWVQGWR